MGENLPVSGDGNPNEKRDRLLRRLIVSFVLAAVVTFWTAVGMSAWNEASGRVELAQQQRSAPAASR
jgi:hypothetical protein